MAECPQFRIHTGKVTLLIKMGKPTKIFKQEIWSLSTADTYFSKHIRSFDLKCKRCRQEKPLDCSHYWRRDMWGTRFDPENCDGICRDCHTIWERQQNLEYKKFMLQKLGRVKYDQLEQRARTSTKRRDAILGLMKFLGGVDNSLSS